MEALREKLNSRRGASILLAMLFLLMCILVGTSVVMAASSNAGKIKSNKEEQQKYLTLSSAVNLLVKELESVEYVGQYTYEYTEYTLPDEPSDPPVPDATYITIHSYKLTNGELRHRDDAPISESDWSSGKLEKLLPLNTYLDGVFAEAYKEKYIDKYNDGGEGIKKDEIDSKHITYYKYASSLLSNSDDLIKYDPLKFEVDYGSLTNEQVRIDVTLEKDGRIFLIASLWEKPADDATGNWVQTDYIMQASLRTEDGEWPAKHVVLETSPTGSNLSFDPIKWKLEYIYKKEVTSVATP